MVSYMLLIISHKTRQSSIIQRKIVVDGKKNFYRKKSEQLYSQIRTMIRNKYLNIFQLELNVTAMLIINKNNDSVWI